MNKPAHQPLGSPQQPGRSEHRSSEDLGGDFGSTPESGVHGVGDVAPVIVGAPSGRRTGWIAIVPRDRKSVV